MALIRCPTHKIPYNDDNPRGCPACAREKEGGGEAKLMQELARASQVTREGPPEPTGSGRTAAAALRPSAAVQPEAKEQPPIPLPPEGLIGRLVRGARERPRLAIGWLLAMALLAVVFVTAGPTFIEAPDPAEPTGEVRSLPVEPNTLVTTVFAMLGPQAPQVVPNAPQLARYAYGTDLTIDALNDRIYAITLAVTSRTWRGLQVGVPERIVRGTLALLGQIQEEGSALVSDPQEIGGWRVYPSLDQRPRRTFLVEVRPPNGCFDVTVDLQPRAVGILERSGRRYAVIGKGDTPMQWVSTRIRIVSRAVSGPYAANAC
ncbi:MAG: hypothetical protein OER90_15660 [Gemmatimonadota bacterium]|nr:hypothetical protein [Gemmatimonadota bacterium]